VIAASLEAQLGPRDDRDPNARLFPHSGEDALRTSIAKACRAAAIPLWSPHDLRHRRISLLHLRGMPWARIGEFVGQRNLSVTADTYSAPHCSNRFYRMARMAQPCGLDSTS
jgi:integrase